MCMSLRCLHWQHSWQMNEETKDKREYKNAATWFCYKFVTELDLPNHKKRISKQQYLVICHQNYEKIVFDWYSTSLQAAGTNTSYVIWCSKKSQNTITNHDYHQIHSAWLYLISTRKQGCNITETNIFLQSMVSLGVIKLKEAE